MPTDLMRTSTQPSVESSRARNAGMVAAALTAALVVLQLVGLAMLERSHALPLAQSVAAAGCAEQAGVPSTPTPYD